MNILWIADPLATFKIEKDTTFAMMREAAKRGYRLFHATSADLFVAERVRANAVEFAFSHAPDQAWFRVMAANHGADLVDFDAVIMRSDPPFDTQYLFATQLLSLAQQQGARVFNSGQAMRDWNEKLAILNFPALIADTMVGTHAAMVRQFLQAHGDVIVKPLDGMGGMGIFRLRTDDPNVNGILEMLMANDTRTVMVQRYIPDIVRGDKRILVIGGEIVPYALARIPQMGETRGNLAAGGRALVQELSPRDWEIAQTIASELQKRGILLAGLDVIGDYLTEINITSPTGFQEIMKQKHFDVAKMFVDTLESQVSGTEFVFDLVQYQMV